VKIINGKIITIHAYIFDTIKIVKKRIQDKEGIPDFGLVSYIRSDLKNLLMIFRFLLVNN